MAIMSVSLPADLVGFVEHEVVEGGYGSSDDVIIDALTLLRHDKELEREKLAVLRRELQIALDEIKAGHYSDRTVEEIAEEVLREHNGR